MNMKKKNAKGFTLIELLIVVAIIGILSAILIPNLLSARERGRVANTQGVIKAAASAAEQFAVDHAFYPNLWTGALNVTARTGGFDASDPGGQRYLSGTLPPVDGWARDLNYFRAPDPNYYKAIIASPGRDRVFGGTATGFDTDIWTCMPGGQVRVSNTTGDAAAAGACN